MAMGKVQLVSMRALDHARLAVIGDCMNLASRLTAAAGQNEIVVSNVLRYALQAEPLGFTELEPVEAKNIGMVRAWQLLPPSEGGEGDMRDDP
jgi:class 3 adenylate cyclase